MEMANVISRVWLGNEYPALLLGLQILCLGFSRSLTIVSIIRLPNRCGSLYKWQTK